ncbi:MAG: hypothetical protein AB1673_09555 [Actinomycetota bacterium]
MGRRVDVDLLVDARRITELLELKRVQLVHYYLRTDPEFPQPVFTPSATTGSFVWYWPDVRRWAARRGRLPAGGPKP